MISANPFEELTAKFVAWAQPQQDIRGVLNVGSRARKKFPADALSDLDLVIITTDPNRYLNETAWCEGLGEVLLTFIEETAVGQQFERRVLYRGGLDVDFAIFPSDAARMLIEGGLPIGLEDIFRRGFRVLVDKDEVFEKLTLPTERAFSPPTALDFIQHVNDFLYHAVWTAKKVRRGELWIAKSCCDVYMKRLLLRMIEWYAHTVHGWEYDTWFEGRFLERWAEPKILDELAKTFAHYDASDITNALLQTVELHRRLSMDAGSRLGYQVSTEKYSEILRLVKSYVTLEPGS